MSSPRAAAAAYLAATLLCGRVYAQVEVFSADAPESQEVEVSNTKMRIKGGTVATPRNLPIPLDDTGFADWRFVNPRRPLQVEEGALLLFINQTPDRIFEVTTRLSLNQASFVTADEDDEGDRANEDELPSTLPLLIYDAFTFTVRPGEEIPPERIDQLIKGALREKKIYDDESLSCYEMRLYKPYLQDKSFGTTLQEVLDLEAAIRTLTKATKDEKAARSALTALDSNSNGKAFADAKEKLEAAISGREHAEAEVRRLRFGRKEVEDPEYLPKVRKDLIAELEARRVLVIQQQRAATEAVSKQSYQKLADFFGRAVDALKKQSPETSQIAPLGRAVPSLRLTDCSISDTITCAATIQVYQNGTNSFPFEVLRLQADPASPAKFTLKFFGEEESPAKSAAYLVEKGAAERFAAPKSSTTLSAVASVGVARDPFIPDNKKSLSCPGICENKPYRGEQRTHYPGTGRIEVVQTFGNLFDGKVSIGFKEGDLGQEGTLSVKLSQYRFNLYSQPGWTFHYGKYTFASPSAGIAINESGEGLRLAYRNYGLARLLKRENTGVDDKADSDHTAWIFDAANLQVPVSFLRTVSITAVYGDDRKDPGTIKFQKPVDPDVPVNPNDPKSIEIKSFSAHEYATVGGQVGFTAFWNLYGTVSAYRSKRTAEEKNAPCGTALYVCDGEGDVGLLTVTRPIDVDEDGKVTRTATFSLGIGTGDDPHTPDIDEGYIGETANYSPDQIFLSSFASKISKRNFVGDMNENGFDSLDAGADPLGAGLSNKRYLGLKYVDNSWSLLATLSRIFDIPRPTSGRNRPPSRSTTTG